MCAERRQDGTADPVKLFLTFVIRQLGELSPNYTLTDVADTLLPALAASINAQSIAIVPGPQSGRSAFVAYGDPVGDLAEWERIAETYSPSSGAESNVYRRVGGVGYSAIHSFVIAPIQMGDSLFGWIVADIDDGDSSAEKEAKTTSLMNASAALLSTYAFASERLQQKEQLLLDVVRSLISAIDARDPQTCGHSVRVAIYASLVADGLGLTQQECDELYLAGLLHDVGKLGIPESIFQKSTSLTDEEFKLVKQHPDQGWKILCRIKELQHILPGILHHHENLDGTGYPDQIGGDDIPLAAKIIAAADAYDALTSDRNYRDRKSHSEALDILQDGSGTQWDPIVIDAVLSKSRQIQRVSTKYRREDHPWRVPGSLEPREVIAVNSNGKASRQDDHSTHYGDSSVVPRSGDWPAWRAADCMWTKICRSSLMNWSSISVSSSSRFPLVFS